MDETIWQFGNGVDTADLSDDELTLALGDVIRQQILVEVWIEIFGPDATISDGLSLTDLKARNEVSIGAAVSETRTRCLREMALSVIESVKSHKGES